MNINISEIIENKLAQMEKDRVIETKIEQAIRLIEQTLICGKK